jgi:hypothetical protein
VRAGLEGRQTILDHTVVSSPGLVRTRLEGHLALPSGATVSSPGLVQTGLEDHLALPSGVVVSSPGLVRTMLEGHHASGGDVRSSSGPVRAGLDDRLAAQMMGASQILRASIAAGTCECLPQQRTAVPMGMAAATAVTSTLT